MSAINWSQSSSQEKFQGIYLQFQSQGPSLPANVVGSIHARKAHTLEGTQNILAATMASESNANIQSPDSLSAMFWQSLLPKIYKGEMLCHASSTNTLHAAILGMQSWERHIKRCDQVPFSPDLHNPHDTPESLSLPILQLFELPLPALGEVLFHCFSVREVPEANETQINLVTQVSTFFPYAFWQWMPIHTPSAKLVAPRVYGN